MKKAPKQWDHFIPKKDEKELIRLISLVAGNYRDGHNIMAFNATMELLNNIAKLYKKIEKLKKVSK